MVNTNLTPDAEKYHGQELLNYVKWTSHAKGYSRLVD